MKDSSIIACLCLFACVSLVPAARASLSVDAGPDRTITVPENSLQLLGTVTGGEVHAVTWSWKEGPADRDYFIQFTNPESLDTTARFLCVGEYIIQVRVESNGKFATDEVRIKVNDRTPEREKLCWKPPELDNPEVIVVDNDSVWYDRLRQLKMDRDYLILMSEEYSHKYGLKISGGRNVVLMGGAITHDEWYTFPRVKKVTDSENRCLLIQSSPGFVHVEGIQFIGEHLSDAVQIGNTDEMAESSVIQLENIYVNQVSGTNPENHADVVQTFAGPNKLRIDHLTGYTGYQGIFLRPQDLGKQGLPSEFNFRNINIVGDPDSAYLFWVGSHRTGDNEFFPDHSFPFFTHNIYGRPRDSVVDNKDQWVVPKPSDNDTEDIWDARTGLPPGGDYVTTGNAGDPGLDYVSPGYMEEDGLWGNVAVGEDGHVDTGEWVGWLYVQGDYVYSYALPGWWYLPEEQLSNSGAWAFRFNPGYGI